MSQKEQGDFEKVSLRLYKGDSARVEEYYPKSGYNKIIRQLVHAHLAKCDAKFEQRIATKRLSGETVNKGDLEDEQ